MSRPSSVPQRRDESPDAFRALFQRNPLPMWIYDSETLGFLEVNDAAVHTYGYSRSEFLRMSILDIRPTEDRARLAEQAARPSADLQVWATPWRHRRKDGSVCLVRVSSHPLEFAGRPARLVTVQDVTEITNTADALRESREHYRFFIGRTAEGVWRAAVQPPVPVDAPEEEQVAGCIRHVRLVEVNDAMFRMYGCTEAKQLLGTQLSSTFDLADHRSTEFFRAFVRSGYRTVELESYEFDRLGAPHWFVNNLLGVVEDGRLTAIWGTQRDVTERRHQEEMVRAARDHVTAMVEASPLPIVGVAPDGVVMTWNRAAETVFGWTAEEAVGKRLMCVPPDKQAEFDEFRSHVVQGNSFTARETVSVRKDGTRIDVSISTAALHDADGRAIGLVATYVDISGRKRAEEALRHSQEQLRQAQKMEAVGRLAGGVAHDFNNLLSAILSYSEMVLADLPNPHPCRDDVEQIRQAGMTRRGAHPPAARLQPASAPAAPDDQPQYRRRERGPDAAPGDRRGHRAPHRARAGPGLHPRGRGSARAGADEPRRQRARRYAGRRHADPHDGERRRARTDTIGSPGLPAGRYVTLSVCDTGVGMTREVQERIFEPFFTTKGPGHGTGLGLSTVYGIVVQSGGHVFATSETGAGSTFTIYLPAHAADAEPAGAPAPPPAVRGGAETVLLVEDEDLVRQLTREILRRNGYCVLEACDGVAALATLRDHTGPIDLLLTDVVMPRMSGRELVEQARPLRPEMRILYVSGYSEEAIARQGQLTEGIELLAKPFTPAALTAKIRQLLDRAS